MSQLFLFAFLLVFGTAYCLPFNQTFNIELPSGKYDYGKVIEASLLFYEAQRTGKLPGNKRISWRGDSMLKDKSPDGKDLTGGYFDAGDFVKFNFPMAAMTTVIAWGAIEFDKAYQKAGQQHHVREMLKWSTDYFIKCHTADNELYAQVGDGDIDHKWIGRPEEYSYKERPRPAKKIDSKHPGTDLAGETAAAMAAVSMVFKKSNSAYAQTLVKHAKKLYEFAYNKRGLYGGWINNNKFYHSDNYKDELVLAAAWLYRATGDKKYLNDAVKLYDQFGLNWVSHTFDWNNKFPAAQVMLYKLTKKDKYKNNAVKYINFLLNEAQKTPEGLIFLSNWGSLRLASNAVFIALQTAHEGIGDVNRIREFAKKQIGYMLGDTGRSFVVGVGKNYPTHPHHRSSFCPSPPAKCDWNLFKGSQPNAHLLTGALVGGPDKNDNYKDTRSDYVHNEVAVDYNAGFQSALAGLLQLEIQNE